MILSACIFHSRMGWLVTQFSHGCGCFLFRSAFRVGDPVIPFFLRAGGQHIFLSFFLFFEYNNRIRFTWPPYQCSMYST